MEDMSKQEEAHNATRDRISVALIFNIGSVSRAYCHLECPPCSNNAQGLFARVLYGVTVDGCQGITGSTADGTSKEMIAGVHHEHD